MRGFGDIAERLRRPPSGAAAGGAGERVSVVVGREGSLVTNAHVVRSRDPLVELWDGRSFRGRGGLARCAARYGDAAHRADSLEAGVRAIRARCVPGELVIAAGIRWASQVRSPPGTVLRAAADGFARVCNLRPQLGRTAGDARGEGSGSTPRSVNGLGLRSVDRWDFLGHRRAAVAGVVCGRCIWGSCCGGRAGGAADLASLRAGDTLLTRSKSESGAGCGTRTCAGSFSKREAGKYASGVHWGASRGRGVIVWCPNAADARGSARGGASPSRAAT